MFPVRGHQVNLCAEEIITRARIRNRPPIGRPRRVRMLRLIGRKSHGICTIRIHHIDVIEFLVRGVGLQSVVRREKTRGCSRPRNRPSAVQAPARQRLSRKSRFDHLSKIRMQSYPRPETTTGQKRFAQARHDFLHPHPSPRYEMSQRRMPQGGR